MVSTRFGRRGLLGAAMTLGWAALSAQGASAAGFYLQDQSVRGLGRAFSGEVADVGPESLWWNPAAIAGAPTEIYGGVNGLLIGSKVSDLGSTVTRPVPPAGLTTPVGGAPVSRGVIENGVVPNFDAALALGPRLDVGLSLFAPYDFTSQYGPAGFARYDGITSRLSTGDLQGTVAFRAAPWLDLGAGVVGEYTHAYLTQAYPNLSPLLADGQSSLKGSGWNAGWTAGARLHGSRWSLGASYRSSMAHDLTGPVSVTGLVGPLAGANLSATGRAHFRTPWIATLGGRFALTPSLWVDGQAQRFGWSRFSAIDVAYPGGGSVLAAGYHDTTSGAVGLDWAAASRLTLRAGFGYDPTPTPRANRSALVPDSDRRLYTLGASYRMTPRLTLEAGAAYIDFIGAGVDNAQVFYAGTPAATEVTTLGRVTGSAEEISGGVRYRF